MSRLPPRVLHDLIRHRGIDACGPIIAAATTAQVASALDLDLWGAEIAGADERFDSRRFGLWLETLWGEGEAVAVRIVAAMDRDLAVFGLSRYVRVFDPAVVAAAKCDVDGFDEFEPAAPGGLENEIGGYVVRARSADVWDAIVGLLTALADEQPDCFHALMRGCRRLSNSTPEADGFHGLMQEPEQRLHDLSIERERRRSAQGYLSAPDARAFLQIARQPRPHGEDRPWPPRAVLADCLRMRDDATESVGPKERSAESGPSSSSQTFEADNAVTDLLAAAGFRSGRSQALLGPGMTDLSQMTPIQPLMESVHATNQGAYSARNRELAVIANALLTGCSVHARPFTVQEAWDAAVGACNLGLETWLAGWDEDGTREAPLDGIPLESTSFLEDHDLLTAFGMGWRLLHDEVSLFVAKRLMKALAGLRSVDPAIDRDLHRLRRALERHTGAGAPWLARDALDAIAILGMPAWACLLGLLSECPVVPAALTAILDGRTRSVSATAFETFATSHQIRKVHEFGGRLLDILLH